MNWKVHTACGLNFIVKGEGLTQGHRQSHRLETHKHNTHTDWKSGNI